MLFCDKCRYVYNVAKDVKNKQAGGKVNEALNIIFEKFSSGKEIVKADLKKVKSKDIFDDERYDSLNKKNQKKFISIIKSIDKDFFLTNNDLTGAAIATTAASTENTTSTAYLICKFCKRHIPIEPNTIIYSKNYGSSSSLDIEDYTYMIYDNTLPRTHNYFCKNSKCITHKNPSIKEAIITKNKSEQAIYVCVQCSTHWINTI